MTRYTVTTILLALTLASTAFAQTSVKVERMQFNPMDPRTLAVGYSDGTVTMWSVDAASPLWNQDPDSDSTRPISALAFSPDGTILTVAAGKGTLRSVNAQSGALRRNHRASEDFYSAVAYSTDGRHFVTSEQGTRLRVWVTETGAIEKQIPVYVGGTNFLGLSSNNQNVYCSGLMSVGIWSMQTGERLAEFRDPKMGGDIALDPDGFLKALILHVDYTADLSYVALGMLDRIVILDTETGKEIHRIEQTGQMFLRTRFSPDQTQLYSFSTAGQVKVHDILTGFVMFSKEVVDWDQDASTATIGMAGGEALVAFSADGQFFAFQNPKSVRQFDVVRLRN